MKTAVQQLLELIPDAYEIKDYIFENDADTKMLDRWLWERMFKGKDWVDLEKQQIIDAANQDEFETLGGVTKGEYYYFKNYKK